MSNVPRAAAGPRLVGDARAILSLGLPLVVGNLAISGVSLSNTMMAGRYGSAALAAVAVGQSYYVVFMVFGTGAMMALSPLVAHAYGRGETRAIGLYTRQSLWIATVLAVLIGLGLAASRRVFERIGTDPAVVPTAVAYVHALAAGIPAMLGFQALRFTADGLGRTRPMMVVALIGLATNVLGNWVLLYGRLGAPALGAVGCAVATAISQWVMLAAMLVHVLGHPRYRPYAIARRPERPDPRRLAEMLRLGVPIAGSMVAESALFTSAGLMMGTLGGAVVAAHQIALNYASFIFMMPVSMHSATMVHVGHALGRGERVRARRAGFVGIGLCGLVMLASALALGLWHDGVAGLYSRDPAVRGLASELLVYAALFQVSDGLQVGAMGALRGFKDARAPLLITIAAYWLVGFPFALVAGVVRGGGPVYVWYGLIAGLTVSALALNLRYAALSRRIVAEAL